jgi:hypothetical protein
MVYDFGGGTFDAAILRFLLNTWPQIGWEGCVPCPSILLGFPLHESRDLLTHPLGDINMKSQWIESVSMQGALETIEHHKLDSERVERGLICWETNAVGRKPGALFQHLLKKLNSLYLARFH